MPTNTCGGVSWRPLDKSSSDKNKDTHKKAVFSSYLWTSLCKSGMLGGLAAILQP